MSAPPTVRVDGVDVQVVGAQVAVIDGNRVLLQLRPFPPGWELPGGHCEPGEDPRRTAARETEEETGYRVSVDALVGVYTWSGLRSAGDVVYLGRITGGRPRRSLEAWATRFVTADELPHTAFPWMHQRIADAFAAVENHEPVHRVQPVTVHHVLLFATAWLRVPIEQLQRRLRRPRSR